MKVAKVALRLVNAGQAQEVVLEGALEELEASARLYPSTNEMRVQLASYKLDVPEGELLKSSSCNGAAMLLECTTNPLPGVDAKVGYGRAVKRQKEQDVERACGGRRVTYRGLSPGNTLCFHHISS